tara:strand:+ start:3468 stop:3977 length:510 start_codon:yes stop_codon:yes gene_type:complete
MFLSRFSRYYTHTIVKDGLSSFLQKDISFHGHASIEAYSQDKKQLGLSFFAIEIFTYTKPTVSYSSKDVSLKGIRKKQLVAFRSSFSSFQILRFFESFSPSCIQHSSVSLISRSNFAFIQHYIIENENVFFSMANSSNISFEFYTTSFDPRFLVFFLSSFQITVNKDAF